MATKKENEVAVVDSKPSYLTAMEGKSVNSVDNFDSTDVVIPRVKLLQGTSAECETFDNAKTGLFWHTGFDVPLGNELNFVVCSRKKKFMLVAPLEDGQGILARADDFKTWDRLGSWQVKLKDRKDLVTWTIDDLNVIKSGLDQWGTYDPDDENSPPAATLFYEYLVLLPDHLEFGPAVLSITRSAVKKAKKGLNDKIQLHQNAGRPMQAIVFQAKSFTDKNTVNQDFKNWQFNGNGFASEALYNQAKELETALQNYKVQDEEAAAMGDEDRPAPASSSDF